MEYERNRGNQYTGLSAAGNALPSPAYDDDGNMTAYDGATYTWNAENRLTAVEMSDKKITFLYDYIGRRVQKKVFSHNGTGWNEVPDETRVFVYNGWNLIRETVTGAASGETYYVWGLDLSQSMQGAGGIGGLLCSVSGGEVRRYTYDANGNVAKDVGRENKIIDLFPSKLFLGFNCPFLFVQNLLRNKSNINTFLLLLCILWALIQS